jgi:hypothetical protein
VAALGGLALLLGWWLEAALARHPRPADPSPPCCSHWHDLLAAPRAWYAGPSPCNLTMLCNLVLLARKGCPPGRSLLWSFTFPRCFWSVPLRVVE